MKDDDSVIISMIITLAGFIVFLLSLLNKMNRFLPLMEQFYVLFLISGLLLSIAGIVMNFSLAFKRQTIFKEHQKKVTFGTFLGIGFVLFMAGFIVIIYYALASKILYIMSMSISVVGLVCMINGLRLYMKEVFH